MEHAHEDLPKICEDVLLLPPLNPQNALAGNIGYRPSPGESVEHPSQPPSHASFEELRRNTAFKQTEIEWYLPTEPREPYEDINCRSSVPLGGSFGFWPTLSHAELSDETGSEQLPYISSSCESLQPGPLSVTSNSRKRHKRKNRRLSTTAVQTLVSWFEQHQAYPYPTKKEKNQLRHETGLEVSQISNWFTNARRRKMIAGEPTPEANHTDNTLLSPLQRWQNSPPESEPAAASDILKALEDIPYTSDASITYPAPPEALSSNSSSASFVVGVPSISSYEHSHSSGSDISFSRSNQISQRPPTPLITTRSRRRRRKPPPPNEALSKRKSNARRPFQCTFCSDTFNTKYDWQRHEKALHLPVDRWICAPQGGLAEVNGTNVCVFCQAPDADSTHLETHDYLACRERLAEQRTFARKDHLRQHLRLTHNVDYHPTMDQWRDSLTHLNSRCGFCNAKFHTWQERVDHVADHFKKGADMIQWKGCWGFDPGIIKLVENAMPAYLVGHERLTMDPWKTTDALATGGDEVLPAIMDVPNALNRYVNLRRDLIAYIREQSAAGNHPTDEMVQDKARHIAYGSNDPFDQTYADNPKWIATLRQEAELMSVPEANCLFPFCETWSQNLATTGDLLHTPLAESDLLWDNLLAEDTLPA